jgi:hypothetical protein
MIVIASLSLLSARSSQPPFWSMIMSMIITTAAAVVVVVVVVNVLTIYHRAGCGAWHSLDAWDIRSACCCYCCTALLVSGVVGAAA